jgi:hypothetical protein
MFSLVPITGWIIMRWPIPIIVLEKLYHIIEQKLLYQNLRRKDITTSMHQIKKRDIEIGNHQSGRYENALVAEHTNFFAFYKKGGFVQI